MAYDNQKRKNAKASNGFWRWHNHIFLKLIGGMLLGTILGETKIIPLVIVGIVFYVITLIYGIIILVLVLYGCFSVVPKTKMRQDILENERKQRRKEDKDLEEYGMIDRDRND